MPDINHMRSAESCEGISVAAESNAHVENSTDRPGANDTLIYPSCHMAPHTVNTVGEPRIIRDHA